MKVLLRTCTAQPQPLHLDTHPILTLEGSIIRLNCSLPPILTYQDMVYTLPLTCQPIQPMRDALPTALLPLLPHFLPRLSTRLHLLWAWVYTRQIFFHNGAPHTPNTSQYLGKKRTPEGWDTPEVWVSFHVAIKLVKVRTELSLQIGRRHSSGVSDVIVAGLVTS